MLPRSCQELHPIQWNASMMLYDGQLELFTGRREAIFYDSFSEGIFTHVRLLVSQFKEVRWVTFSHGLLAYGCICMAGKEKKQKKVDADCIARPPFARPSLSKVVASFSSPKFLFRNLVFWGKLPCRKTRWSAEERGEWRWRQAHVLPSFASLPPLLPLRPPKASLSNFPVVNCT